MPVALVEPKYFLSENILIIRNDVYPYQVNKRYYERIIEFKNERYLLKEERVLKDYEVMNNF